MNVFAFHVRAARHRYIFYDGNLEWILHVEVTSYYIFHSTGLHSLTFNCIRARCMINSAFDAHFILFIPIFLHCTFSFSIHYAPWFVSYSYSFICYLINSFRNYIELLRILSRWKYMIIRRELYEFYLISKAFFKYNSQNIN